jgi:hypothetical protein
MATLIKVDNKFINLDNVTEIHSYELQGWNVIVYYAATTNSCEDPPQQDFEHFTGKEAAALRKWLEQHSTDVVEWHKTQDRNNLALMYNNHNHEYA